MPHLPRSILTFIYLFNKCLYSASYMSGTVNKDEEEYMILVLTELVIS